MDTLTVAKVVTQDVESELQSLVSERRELLVQNYIITQRIIKGAKVLKTDYDDVMVRLKAVEDMISMLEKDGLEYVVVEKAEMALPKPMLKPKPKPKRKGALSEEDVLAIKKKAKETFVNVFKFRTVEECKDTKRSAPHYMSKDAIVKAIAEHEDIKAAIPKSYRSMKKEEICDALWE